MEVEINQDALGLRMCQFCFTNCMLSCSNRFALLLYQNLQSIWQCGEVVGLPNSNY